MNFNRIPLTASSPGQQMSLNVHRFGPAGGKKVYIQAGLHADEHPGLLVAQHLLRLLQQLEENGQLAAEFVVVPFANPLGLNQKIFGYVNGRCDLGTGQNFNRGMAIDRGLFNAETAALFEGDAEHNDARFREFLCDAVNQRVVRLPIEVLHKALLSQSIDAHYMFDLHCDDVALPHLFYGSHQSAIGQRLAQCLGYEICLEEDVTGTVAYDATHTQPWVLMQQHMSAHRFSQPCFAATLELRGQADVNRAFAEQDAKGILDFCAQEGLISGLAVVTLAQSATRCLGVDQVKMVSAPANGIITYDCQLGDELAAGDKIGEIVLLDEATPSSIDIVAPCAGKVFSLTGHHYVSPGHTLAMLATHEQQLAPGQQLAF